VSPDVIADVKQVPRPAAVQLGLDVVGLAEIAGLAQMEEPPHCG